MKNGFSLISYIPCISTAVCLMLLIVSCNDSLVDNASTDSIVLYPKKMISLSPDKSIELASKIEDEVNVELNDAFDLSLWASDSLVADPIAISIAPNGKIYYTQASRQSNSEFDIRGHQNWITASISFQTNEDRSKFLKETFTENNEESKKFLEDLNEDGVLDWRDLAVQKEQVWVIDDVSKDGVADQSQLYLEDFNEEITDVANGVEYSDGVVYISVGPDLWRSEDTDGDGIADKRKSLSRGYAIHIGFSGHGMSGVKRGPDGRVYWGIGDIGANVVDKTGKRWKYPNRGVIARSETDGSGFEIYCFGVRNTHEFVFDKYGNLISEDNDGDHRGERERLVHLLNGSETGWRINWQFGKYTDPKNNTYKVWMDEKMHVPHWEGQAAYFLPPIVNYVNGPTGMVYNPGTALGPDWYEHFFISEFRGSPANSPIHAFTLKPKGASFELDKTTEVVKGLLPTGLDFGPDGALYFGDWIDGWATNDAGRIWKIDVPNGANTEIRLKTKDLAEADFSKLAEADLVNHLTYQDMRIRQKAQFELAKRGEAGFQALQNTAKESDYQLARIHSLWGMGQMARSVNMDYALAFVSFLTDADDEIKAQAAKMIGDVKYAKAGDELIPLLSNTSPRVQLLTIEALGRLEHKAATQPILDLMEKNNDQDLWLRHAGMVALGRIGDEEAMAALQSHASKAVRTVAVVALRRMESPRISDFLNDQNEFIIAEAARGINDDFSIEAALPDLAKVLDQKEIKSETILRRAINANLRVGGTGELSRLANYAASKNAPAAMRAEAIHALISWDEPSVFDRVDGRYRGVIKRDKAPVVSTLLPLLPTFISDSKPKIKVVAAQLAAYLDASEQAPALMKMLKLNRSNLVRSAALTALSSLEAPTLSTALEIAMTDSDKTVRSRALELLPSSDIPEDKAVALFDQVLQTGTSVEQQSVLKALGQLKGASAISSLDKLMNQLVDGKINPDIKLDLIEAVEENKDAGLQSKLLIYQSSNEKKNAMDGYWETLAGGNIRNGHDIFYEHQAAQCVKCHTVFEYGGNAGPGLAGVADRLSPEQLLESVIMPSESFASGYEVVSLELADEEYVAGFVIRENDEQYELKVGKDILEVKKKNVVSKTNLPSSMPPMGNILTKYEIRDLIAFLGSLKEQG